MTGALGVNGARMWLERRGRWAVCALALVVMFAAACRQNRPSGQRTVVVEMSASAGSSAQMFWSDDATFAAERSVRASLGPPTDARRTLRFPIPRRGVQWLRLHPADAPGEIRIHRLQVFDSQGSTTDVALDNLVPGDGIATFATEGDGVRLITTATATNASLLVPLACLQGELGRRFGTVSPLAIALLTLAAVALLAASAGVIGRAALLLVPIHAAGSSRPESRRSVVFWCCALLLVVTGGKLLLMQANPTTVPVWDQWDGEAAVFALFANCSLSWQALFDLHNEHRIFFTRLLALDLLMLNDQWDPRLEQVANAALHGLTAVLVSLMFWMAAGRKRLDLVVVLAALTFALPFSWENTLIGFQSAFYFLILFSMLSIWLATSYPAGSGAWLLGWACCFCALHSAATGLLAAVTIAATTVLAAAGDRSRRRDAAANVVMGLVMVAVGYALSAPLVPDQFRARSAAEFLTSLGRGLAWPWIDRPELALLAWLPIALTLLAALRRRLATTDAERLNLGLALWVVLHAVALAYGRGARAGAPVGRYMDFLSVGFLVNAMAFAGLVERVRGGITLRRLAHGACAAWLLFSIVGLNSLVRQSLTAVAGWDKNGATVYAERLRRFVLTNDADVITQAPYGQLPYPDPNRLLMLLQNPYIRKVLPAAVRTPIPVSARTIGNGAFVPDGTFHVAARDPLAPSWGSYSGAANAAQGTFESEPIPPCKLGGSLRFDVAGHLGYDDHILAVRDVRTGRETRAARRGPVRDDGWSTAFVSCPDGPFTIVAADNSRWSWFAFRPPVEIGSASVAAERLIDAGWPILAAGLILFGLAARWTR